MKRSNCPKWNFSLKKTITFSYIYYPLSFCKILKEFLELIQSYQDVPFLGQKWPTCPEQFFLVQTIITFIYLLAVFIVQNLQKNYTADLKLSGCAILGPKMVHLPQNNFFVIINIIFIYISTFHLPIIYLS